LSQENVEIVRRVYDALRERDAATILELYDPDVTLVFAPGTVFDHIGEGTGRGGTYHGHQGLRIFDRDLRQTFEDVETNYEELTDAGERVVSVSRYRARGRDAIEVEGRPQFGVWTIDNRKITRVDWFASREEALEAAGLSP
jgi:ketosteroid isomerase-like protein